MQYTHPKSEKFKNEAFVSQSAVEPAVQTNTSRKRSFPKRASKRRNLKRSLKTLKHALKMHVGWQPDALYTQALFTLSRRNLKMWLYFSG